MTQNLIPIGIAVTIIGIIIILIGAMNLQNNKDSKTKVAIGGFIGFIPFGFGNDKDTVKTLTIISIIFLILWILIQILFNLKLK